MRVTYCPNSYPISTESFAIPKVARRSLSHLSPTRLTEAKRESRRGDGNSNGDSDLQGGTAYVARCGVVKLGDLGSSRVCRRGPSGEI